MPATIHKLNLLRYFNFSGNVLNDWTPILSLNLLEKLKLSYSSINHIPSNISELSQLEELDLSHNNISELPKSLLKLKKLRVLDLSNNPLKKLPEWISKMRYLKEINLTQTQLSTLPESITKFENLKILKLNKNPFKRLPSSMLNLPKKMIELEERNRALYDKKAKLKIDKYPKGNAFFENDFNLKLMIIQKLMYEDEILLPKFDMHDFVKSCTDRVIDLEKEGFNMISEVRDYFKKLPIPMELLIDIKALQIDIGDEIYSQLIPEWDRESNIFEVVSISDIHLLPNLKRISRLFLSKEVIKELRSKKIKVNNG